MCASVWVRVCINAEHITSVYVFLSQLPHGADCLCSWSLRFSAHHRPPVKKHPHNMEEKMSAGHPVLKLLLLLHEPATLS